MSENTRRDFLKASAVAGAALATNFSLLSNVHAAGSDVIKVGLIGCGGRGTQACENVLNSAPGVQVLALGDVFEKQVKGCQKWLKEYAQKEESVKKHGNSVDLPDDR